MSLNRKGNPTGHAYQTYPYHHPNHGRQFIIVHDHDVLSGRGVNIAQHPGNERFRALVQTRHDADYCASYTTTEKRAVAQEIVIFIHALEPPGRFLKRLGKANTARGLKGPWELLSQREAIKKTCQALRDCNRQDRTGYAAQVAVPDDVRQHQEIRSMAGLTNKEYAEERVHVARQEEEAANMEPYAVSVVLSHGTVLSSSDADVAETATAAAVANPSTSYHSNNNKRSRDDFGAVTPSLEHAAEWLLKKQPKQAPQDEFHTPAPQTTPTTVATSGGDYQGGFDDSFASAATASTDHHHHHRHDAEYPNASMHNMPLQPPSPETAAYHHHHNDVVAQVGLGALYADTFDEGRGSSVYALAMDAAGRHGHDHHHHATDHDSLDPLHLAAEAAAAIEGTHHHHHHQDEHHDHHDPLQAAAVDEEEGYPPPSPFHPDHHGGLTDEHYDDHV